LGKGQSKKLVISAKEIERGEKGQSKKTAG